MGIKGQLRLQQDSKEADKNRTIRKQEEKNGRREGRRSSKEASREAEEAASKINKQFSKVEEVAQINKEAFKREEGNIKKGEEEEAGQNRGMGQREEGRGEEGTGSAPESNGGKECTVWPNTGRLDRLDITML